MAAAATPHRPAASPNADSPTARFVNGELTANASEAPTTNATFPVSEGAASRCTRATLPPGAGQ